MLSSSRIGVMLVDEFTGAAMEFLSKVTQASAATVADFVSCHHSLEFVLVCLRVCSVVPAFCFDHCLLWCHFPLL